MASQVNSNQKVAKTLDKVSDEGLIRGATPPDIESKCLALCQQFIGGSWNSANQTEVIVKRIGGGLTNQLYYVGLADQVPSQKNVFFAAGEEPREVTVKLFQPKLMPGLYRRDSERLIDMVVTQLVADANIGPKLYGIFDDGVIQSYHKHENFKVKHQQNDSLLRLVAHQLAKINALNVPLPRRPDCYLMQMQACLDSAYQKFNLSQLAKQFDIPTLVEYDLRQEFAKLKSFIEKFDAPIVLCHVDFRNSNIMVIDDRPGRESLLVCDFEEASYGPRGLDMGFFFGDWGKDGFDIEGWRMPTDQEIAKFARFYLEQFNQLRPGYSNQPENSVERLIRETKVGLLVYIFWGTLFLLDQSEGLAEGLEFDLKEHILFIERCYHLYVNQLRKRLIEEGIYPM